MFCPGDDEPISVALISSTIGTREDHRGLVMEAPLVGPRD